MKKKIGSEKVTQQICPHTEIRNYVNLKGQDFLAHARRKGEKKCWCCLVEKDAHHWGRSGTADLFTFQQGTLIGQIFI